MFHASRDNAAGQGNGACRETQETTVVSGTLYNHTFLPTTSSHYRTRFKITGLPDVIAKDGEGKELFFSGPVLQLLARRCGLPVTVSLEPLDASQTRSSKKPTRLKIEEVVELPQINPDSATLKSIQTGEMILLCGTVSIEQTEEGVRLGVNARDNEYWTHLPGYPLGLLARDKTRPVVSGDRVVIPCIVERIEGQEEHLSLVPPSSLQNIIIQYESPNAAQELSKRAAARVQDEHIARRLAHIVSALSSSESSAISPHLPPELSSLLNTLEQVQTAESNSLIIETMASLVDVVPGLIRGFGAQNDSSKDAELEALFFLLERSISAVASIDTRNIESCRHVFEVLPRLSEIINREKEATPNIEQWTTKQLHEFLDHASKIISFL